MKPRLLLLSLCFLLFYLFTDMNWQIGNYLAGNDIYRFLKSWRGLAVEVSNFLPFLLDNLLSYGLFFVLYYRRRLKVAAITGYLLVTIPVMICGRYLIQETLFYSLFGYHNYGEHMRVPARYFMDNIYFAIYYSMFGIVFFFLQLSSYNQRRQQELVLQNRNAELSFLRSQINPHFLFNSLNNVYTLVYQGSPNALPSISTLSELLRYMLYEKAELVPLQKEVQFLRNYIDLQLMRYNFEPALAVTTGIPADLPLKIAPLTLIPFVENAFKHGDLKDASFPLTISIAVNEGRLFFEVINKKGRHQKDETGGIGLDNVRKRLTLIYGERRQLTIDDQDLLFSVQLNIQLHE
ncbi:sensor histidine kinase [Hufsiella ginkgonis]|uniref:Histidine kinase n=1 Tax=Hufsiella ginkgonis TaxID=2695274 RepID=A0A7K1XYR4_9SPHI|nr:histidine kinase [Hufsiella ginkgonis]MXV15968.1 histidine kinase [Hufsiella ginkgonis]